MNMSSYKCCNINTLEFKTVTNLSRLLKLVGEESRLKLLCMLLQNEYCVCELLSAFEMSQSLISHHLADLKQAGLIESIKKGRRVYYSLTSHGKKVTELIFSLKIDHRKESI